MSGLRRGDIHKELVSTYPDRKIPSIATIGRIIDREINSNLEVKQRDEVLQDIKESFRKIKLNINRVKELTYDKANTSYLDRRNINREFKEVFIQIDNLNTELDNIVSSYFDKKNEFVLKFQHEVLLPLELKHPIVKGYLRELINKYLEK